MTGLLRGVDLASFAVAFAVRLRRRGVPVGFTGIETLTRAVDVGRPRSLPELYWLARVSLVQRHSELAAFDAVFAEVFEAAGPPLDPHARRFARTAEERLISLPGAESAAPDDGGLPWATLPTPIAVVGESQSAFGVPERLPSDLAARTDVPFEQLADRELNLLGEWLASTLTRWPTRRTRRLTLDQSGHRVAVRETIARSRRTGWEPVDVICARPVRKPRRVVMLCDVSQSMQAQAAAYLHLMRALALVADAEVFAFATGLTRLTTALAHRSTAVAMEQATAKVTDRFGGTRIATNLQALLASHHGGAVRGAIVIIGSDGWDSDDPQQLAAAMARLRRRAHRVIWLNPRAGAPGFAPLVGPMAAALPYCDTLLPADTFRSLAGVVAELSRATSSTASRTPTGGSGRR